MINSGISFIAFLAIFFAFKCVVSVNNTNAGTNLSSQSYKDKGIVVEGNKNTVNLCHDKEIKTALSQIQKSLASFPQCIRIDVVSNTYWLYFYVSKL